MGSFAVGTEVTHKILLPLGKVLSRGQNGLWNRNYCMFVYGWSVLGLRFGLLILFLSSGIFRSKRRGRLRDVS